MNDIKKVISEVMISKRMGIFLYEYDKFNYILFTTPEFPFMNDILKTRQWNYEVDRDEIVPWVLDQTGYKFSKKYKDDLDQVFASINLNAARTRQTHIIRNFRGVYTCSTQGINLDNAADVDEIYQRVIGVPNTEVVSLTVDGVFIPPSRDNHVDVNAREIIVETIYPVSKVLKVVKEKREIAATINERTADERLYEDARSRGYGSKRDLTEGKAKAKTPERYVNENILDRRVNQCGTGLCGSNSRGILDDGTKKCGLCGCNGHSRNFCACPSCGLLNSHVCSDCPILDAQYKVLQREGKPELCDCSTAGVCRACKTFDQNFFLVEIGKTIEISAPMKAEDIEMFVNSHNNILPFNNLFGFFFNREKYGTEKIFTNSFFTHEIRNKLKKIFERSNYFETGRAIERKPPAKFLLRDAIAKREELLKK